MNRDVALLSRVVEVRSQQYQLSLVAQGVAGDLLIWQSMLIATHTSFLVAAGLALIAFVTPYLVPKRKKAARAPVDVAPQGN